MPFKVASESFVSGVGGDSIVEESKSQNNSQHKRRLKSLLVKKNSPANNSSVNVN